jgi:glycerol dehydrogenase-like iron-containing ADH family enzyme
MYIFNKFRIIVLIDELFISIKKQAIEEEFIQKKTRYNTKIKASQTNVKKEKIEKISSQIKIDVVVGKSISYYLFLVFFRWAIMII